MKRKNNINYPKSAAMGVVSKGLKNEFETAKVNEPSVFEPLRFYCILLFDRTHVCACLSVNFLRILSFGFLK